MEQSQREVDFLDAPQAKRRVWLVLSSLLLLVLAMFARCGRVPGTFRQVSSTTPSVQEPWGWWMDGPFPLRRPEPPLYVFRPYVDYREPDGPPNLCAVKTPGVPKPNDIIIAYQWWMGPGYSIADLGVRQNRSTTYEVLLGPTVSPKDFPKQSCEPGGVLSERTIAEFYDLLERLHLCDDPPRATWENVGIDPLCVRKGDDVCLIGIGDTDDPRVHVLRLAVARLAINGCTSSHRVPFKYDWVN